EAVVGPRQQHAEEASLQHFRDQRRRDPALALGLFRVRRDVRQQHLHTLGDAGRDGRGGAILSWRHRLTTPSLLTLPLLSPRWGERRGINGGRSTESLSALPETGEGRGRDPRRSRGGVR